VSEADRRREQKVSRALVILGAIWLAWAGLMALADLRAGLSWALGGLFLLSLGGRVVLAERHPRMAWALALLAGLLPLAMVASVVAFIASQAR